jgi:hypothetical protein
MGGHMTTVKIEGTEPALVLRDSDDIELFHVAAKLRGAIFDIATTLREVRKYDYQKPKEIADVEDKFYEICRDNGINDPWEL